jgi:hypothetical protein
VELTFPVGDLSAQFRRNSFSGRASLVVGDQVMTLQSPYRLDTHFQLKSSQTWTRTVDGHVVEVVKERPVVMGGVRSNSYRVLVDGVVVAKGEG